MLALARVDGNQVVVKAGLLKIEGDFQGVWGGK
jgi:hypothetical protein